MVKNFFRLPVLLLAFVSFAVFSACNDSDDAGGDAPTPPLQELNGPFDITFDNITATSVYMSVKPNGYSGGYYFDLLTAENYAINLEHGFDLLIEHTVNSIIANNEGVTREEALQRMMSHNADEWEFLGLDQGAEYFGVAMGIDADGRICTGVKSVKFETVKVDMSGNTFDITLSNITHDGTDYKVVPAVKSENYVVSFINRTVADELASDDKIVEWCMSMVQDPSSLIVSGDVSRRNQHICQPGRDYYVVAFGFESGIVTTPVTKVPFTTTTDADPATCTFDISVTNITYNSALVSVTPSNQYNTFFSEVITVDDLEMFKEVYGTTDASTAMAKAWEEEILPSICEEMTVTPAQLLDMVCTWGNAVGGSDVMERRLKTNTKYVVWAACLDANGKPQSPFSFSAPFTTSQEVISEGAKVELKLLEYFDGADLKEYGYNGNFAVAVVEATPSAGVTTWYTGIFGEDLSDAARQSCLNSLVKYEGGIVNANIVVGAAYWDDTLPNTALAVAVDDNGDYGEISRLVINCSKDKVSPAANFAKYVSSSQQQLSAPKPMCLK